MASESKAAFKIRLMESGDWDEFVALRDQLITNGMGPSEARQEAKRQIDAKRLPTAPVKFGSNGSSHDESSGLSAPNLEGLDFGKRVSHNEAVEWVASNIANLHALPKDAPDGRAWAMLTWVRQSGANETTFWTTINSKAVAGVKQPTEPEGEWDGKGPCPVCKRETVAPVEDLEKWKLKELIGGLLENEDESR